MTGAVGWIILIVCLTLGTLAGILGGKSAHWLFWVLWIPALAGVAIFIFKSGSDKPAAADSVPEQPSASIPEPDSREEFDTEPPAV